MPDRTKFNMEFRPETYFKERDPEQIERLINSWHARFGEWPSEEDFFNEDSDPWVTIASVYLRSTLSDVIMIEARPEHGAIYYRVVDEYETKFEFGPKASLLPLTMEEMIGLIDGVEGAMEGRKGLTSVFRDYNMDSGGDDPENLRNFVYVKSNFYPELETWYDHEAEEWYRDQLRKLGADG